MQIKNHWSYHLTFVILSFEKRSGLLNRQVLPIQLLPTQ